MIQFAKRLKVGKVERYTLGLTAWLDGESLTSVSAEACGTEVQVNSSDFVGATVGLFVEGLSSGIGSVIVSYQTATRSDSVKVSIVTVDADTCPV